MLNRSFYLLMCLWIYQTNAEAPIEEVMKKLIKLVSEEQVLKAEPFRFPRWEKKLGLYRSEIRIDFHGEPIEADLRTNPFIYVFDNNMFATGWITTVLLESNMYGNAPQSIDAEHLSLAMDAINTFHDRNLNDSTAPIMTFWSQIYNESTHVWQSTPDNLNYLCADLADNLKVIEKLLEALGIRNIAKLIEKLVELSESGREVFEIPSDFDDTYLNLGLGVQLKLLQEKYPSIYPRWAKLNSNMKKLVDLTLRYAYRPSSANLDQNCIDPRTYFWIRDFVHENPQVILPATWTQNITEVRKMAHLGVRMPFNLNNIDVTVGANVLYGITSAMIHDLFDFKDYFNDEMQTLYLSTGSLISWSIKNTMKGRPDLAQVYYPSNYNFLWYGSRSLFLLECARQQDQTMPDVFNRVYSLLANVYREDVVKFFQRNVRDDQSSYDDFLGVNDTTIFGKPDRTGEDRIFSTAQTVNILIASFTYLDKSTGKLKWIDYDEKQMSTIQTMMKKSVIWLIENAFKYQPFNCFFSGSVKGVNQVPLWYPANVYQFLNGSTLDPDHINPHTQSLVDAITGISGIVDETIYNQMINETHFNVSTPVTFAGYNARGVEFPFWSSQPYTHAVAFLALAQYNNLENEINFT